MNRILGRLDEAEAAYDEAIRRDEELTDRRGVAVNEGQLGQVRLRQGRYQEAMECPTQKHTPSLRAWASGRSVAVAWHQIGVVHRSAEQFERADAAYR